MLTAERDDAAQRVAELAARVAEVPALDADASLAEAGLDSIGYAELALAVHEHLGVRLAEAAVERLRTPRQIAAELARLNARRPAPRIPNGLGRGQRWATATAGPILSRYYHVRVEGNDHVPSRGPAIVCSNHNSLLDIPFLVIASPRPIWFMAKMELFRGPLATRFFHTLGGFPVRRAVADMRAVDTALAVVRSGRLLGMYPEGTRSRDVLLPFLPGAAWLALVTGVPLVPVGVRGTAESLPRGRKIPKRTHVRVAFGRPIEVDPEPDTATRKARAEEITAELRDAVATLLS